MSHIAPVSRFLCLLILAVASLFISPNERAWAQSVTPEATSTEAVATSAPTTVPGGGQAGNGDQQASGDEGTPMPEEPRREAVSDATPTQLDPQMAFVVILALLGLALIVLYWLFQYLKESRSDYYRTVREFARKGVAVKSRLVPATGTDRVGGAPAGFEVVGPGLIVPGEPAVYKALWRGAPALDADWEVERPAGAEEPDAEAKLDPRKGAMVSITAAKPGAFVLRASRPETQEQAADGTAVKTAAVSIGTVISVEEAQVEGEAPVELPFIGQGFGSIVGAIVLLAVLVVLAATQAIDQDVVGVILGALAGYLFGVGISQAKS